MLYYAVEINNAFTEKFLYSRIPIIRHSFHFIGRAVSEGSILSTFNSACNEMKHTPLPRTAKNYFLFHAILYFLRNVTILVNWVKTWVDVYIIISFPCYPTVLLSRLGQIIGL